MHQKYSVAGMSCSACSARVEKSVKKVEGVSFVNVNLLSNTMTVDYDHTITNDDQIISSVVQAGYGASVFDQGVQSAPKGPFNQLQDEVRQMKNRVLISFAFLVPLMYISMGHMLQLRLPDFLLGMSNAITLALVQFLLTLPIVYVNRNYYEAGFKTLFRGAPNMDSLIAIGSSAALIYGLFAVFQIGYGLGHDIPGMVETYTMDMYFESAAMILTLITLGKYLETRSKGKTSEAISRLIDLAPKTATVWRNGAEIEIPVEEVTVGEILIVRPGQSIPVDGMVIEGNASIDQSALTGESIPVEKTAGDQVKAATINQSGFLKFQAQQVGNDTTLAQIIRLVEEASSSKAPIAKLADKISGVFVPIVIAIAVISAVVWLLLGKPFLFALTIGIAVLVISCPCALGLATPVAIMVGTGRGAANGILIKSAEALETLHTVKTMVLDKTGTITEGRLTVTDMVATDGVTEDYLLQVAASIENPSEHPLAKAIVEKARQGGVACKEVEQFTALPGRGITAVIDGLTFQAGNLAFMGDNSISTAALQDAAQTLARNGKTPLYFARDGHLLGMIAMADTVKSTSREAIGQMQAMGIDVVMLTGDNRNTAEAIRQQLNIGSVVAEVLPQDKESEIRQIQQKGKKVAMVGDGINDAPALARADVGIAIGAGTDIAIESADIVLMKNDLLDVVAALQLSKAVIRNIRQNLFWAFFYNIIGIPLAAGLFYPVLGWKLNPMFAAAAMSMSSVCVVSNALRLRFFKPAYKKIESNNHMIGEDYNMKKIMTINGMSCQHCQASVEKALNAIDGVKAKVDLNQKKAVITLDAGVSDEILNRAVTDAGYEVVSIKDSPAE
ncbi:MAG TPA: heavy metal translocating P-type ATPase [Syntrophomonas sp.]|jgi:Cu+-exporting ATPase|nr:heavy metal translocating P-type ATPase [Syntrophomonas sp.]